MGKAIARYRNTLGFALFFRVTNEEEHCALLKLETFRFEFIRDGATPYTEPIVIQGVGSGFFC